MISRFMRWSYPMLWLALSVFTVASGPRATNIVVFTLAASIAGILVASFNYWSRGPRWVLYTFTTSALLAMLIPTMIDTLIINVFLDVLLTLFTLYIAYIALLSIIFFVFVRRLR